jgi:hypothetical protein
MFENLFKATVGLLVETPIALVADAITLGGSLTDKEVPYTATAVSGVVKNVQKAAQ